MKALVIGGGLLGISTAYFLGRCGWRVAVVERRHAPGLETSYANGALLSPSMPEPWNAPGCTRELVRSLGRRDAALQLRLKAMPRLARWGIDFLRHSHPARYEANTRRNLRLALHSRATLEALRSQTRIEYGAAATGTLRVFRDAAALEAALAWAERLRADGLEFRPLNPQDTVALEPALAPIGAQLVGGIHYPLDSVGNAHAYCVALAAVARELGVEFHFGAEVREIHASGARVSVVLGDGRSLSADHGVVAAGSYTPMLLRSVGVRLPVQPVKGYSLTFERPPRDPPLRIPISDDDLHAVVVPLQNVLRVAGTAEFAGYDLGLPAVRVRNLAGLVSQVLPRSALDPGEGRPWCGLRPMTPDGVPIIGATGIGNLWLNTGHGALGWTLAAGSGQLLADLMSGTPPGLDPEPYAPARFGRAAATTTGGTIGRREFLVGAAAATTVATARRHGIARGGRVPMHEWSAVEVVAALRNGDLTVERYAQAVLERCETWRDLNAFITLEPDRVLADARARDRERRAGVVPGPLFGLPIPVKDSVNTAEYRTTGGTPALRHFHPREDAPLVAALRAAGAIVLGKTNLHELSYGWTSDNLAFGAVHNPYDTNRIPGGSSGGTAAAIAARIAPLGVAEDTEGSIRVPAALCGIVGLRPTTGRYSTQGCIPITPLFDQLGPHARRVADLALFDAVISGDRRPLPRVDLRRVRLGVVRDYWFTGLDPDVERLTEEALARLRGAGVQIVETQLPGLASLIAHTTIPVQDHDVRLSLAKYLHRYDPAVSFDQLVREASPDIRAVFEDEVLPGSPHFVTEAVYTEARDRYLPQLRTAVRDYFERTGVAAIVFPATRVPATRIGEDVTVEIAGRSVPFANAIARNIAPGSTAGVPGLVMPIGLSRGGLPIALEFDAPAGADRALLALGLALEPVLGRIPAPIAPGRPART
ncbi:MAG: D-amino acid dehydrogenase [Gammaproteobacteria bacterium]|nr:D-amino acid dehydrogenase [Gammaproteobacteria bacterium]